MSGRKGIPLDFEQRGECFIVTSHAPQAGGHILLMRNWEPILAHRLIYEECFGFIPSDMVVRHTCDNPNCVNPEHLILGTHEDNVADRVSRGRSARGEKCATSKLTEENVREIRASANMTTGRGRGMSGILSGAEIGRRFGISGRSVGAIKRHETWRHVS